MRMAKTRMRMMYSLIYSLAFALVLAAAPAYAVDFNELSDNIIGSVENLPGLISGLCYMIGLVLGVMGVVKLKQHVEDPRSTPLREPMIRLLTGGALFALPICYEAMYYAITAGNNVDDDQEAMGEGFNSLFDFLAGLATAVPLQDINQILGNIIDSFEETPGLITGLGYLCGLVVGVTGVLKLKDHVLNPEQTTLKEGVVRLLYAGALFAIPTIVVAAYRTINGDGASLLDTVYQGIIYLGFVASSEDPLNYTSFCPVLVVTNPFSLGSTLCQIIFHTVAFPTFLAGFSYLLGLVVIVWGMTKLKDHVLNPNNVSAWEGFARIIVGGALFAMPTVLNALYVTMASLAVPHTGGAFNDGGAVGNGLDTMMVAFTANILGPAQSLMNWFGYVAGIILVIIGITRLMRSAQEGVRGPGGVGTLMTFLAAGALISFSPMVTAFTGSMFTIPMGANYATLNYTVGLGPDELGHIHAVISAVLRFVIVIGLVSFLRGIFIVRSVAEGDNQASMMAGVTHLIGGALAVNLGPFLNAVQNTLGLAGYGVNFTMF